MYPVAPAAYPTAGKTVTYMIIDAITQIGIPGGVELLVVLAIGVLLFGANRIPQLARASGEAIGEFKRGREELEDELEEDIGEEDVETAD